MQSDPYIELSTHSCQGVCFTVFKRPDHSYTTRATDTRCQGTDYLLRLPAVLDLADCIYSVFARLDPTDAHLEALRTYQPDAHPTFKRVHGLARKAIYEAMAKEPVAYPRYADYLKAQDMGIDLKPSPPMLTPWRPNAADPDLQPRPAPTSTCASLPPSKRPWRKASGTPWSKTTSTPKSSFPTRTPKATAGTETLPASPAPPASRPRHST